MIIKTKPTAANFIIIAKQVIFSNELSWKAKGILTYLMGHPENWETRVNDIVTHGTDKEYAVRAGLKELRDKGYAKLTPIRQHGKIIDWSWEICDRPIFKKPDRENHNLVEPDREKPDVENHDLVKEQNKPETPVIIESQPDRDFQDVENHDSNKKEINKIDQENKIDLEQAQKKDTPAKSVARKNKPRDRGELKPYGEDFQNVFLSDDEYQKLLVRIQTKQPNVNGQGEQQLRARINRMAVWQEQPGKQHYQDHFLALISWHDKDLRDGNTDTKPKQQSWKPKQSNYERSLEALRGSKLKEEKPDERKRDENGFIYVA